MTIEQHFLADLHAGDRTAAAIFGDWLDEQGRGEDDVAQLARGVGRFGRVSAWPGAGSLAGLTDHQRTAVAVATLRPVGVLTGGPGTGKTRCIAELVAVMCQQELDQPDRGPGGHLWPIALCAPTGRAALRMGESLRLLATRWHGRPQTIHQLLEVGRNGHDGHGWGFQRGRGNPLRHQTVIVDEASMLDTSLCASLLDACDDRTHVLFVGDPVQLPPVGRGHPLRDLIASGAVPVGELREVHRNAGDIARACDDLRRTGAYRPGAGWQSPVFHAEADAVHAVEALEQIVRALPLERWGGMQVITATNALRKQANAALRRIMNPEADFAERWSLGDRVICLRNGWYRGPRGDHWLANGDIGTVTGREGSHGYALFFGPNRSAFLDPENFDLAWCITTHRSQGGEWDTVVALIDGRGAARTVASRELWYTALSRAKRQVVTVGPWRELVRQAAVVRAGRRKTFLAELLTNGQTS